MWEGGAGVRVFVIRMCRSRADPRTHIALGFADQIAVRHISFAPDLILTVFLHFLSDTSERTPVQITKHPVQYP